MLERINGLKWSYVTKAEIEQYEEKIKKIIEGASIFFEVPIDEILSKERHAEKVMARHVSMYLLNKYIKAERTQSDKHRIVSLEQTASLFDADHATLLHAVKNIEWFYGREADLTRRLEKVKKHAEL
jgi:chromosomal replication initiation ATPase DnaA